MSSGKVHPWTYCLRLASLDLDTNLPASDSLDVNCNRTGSLASRLRAQPDRKTLGRKLSIRLHFSGYTWGAELNLAEQILRSENQNDAADRSAAYKPCAWLHAAIPLPNTTSRP